MILFQKNDEKTIPAGIRTVELLIHLPDALTSALSGQINFMPKRSNTEKIVHEQLNDEKTIKKRRFLIKKNDVRNDKKTTKKRLKNDDFNWKKNDLRNDKKTTKKRSFLTLKRRLKRRKLMKTKKTTTKRRKRWQNDEKRQLLTKDCRFLVVVLNTGMVHINNSFWEQILL